MSSKMLIDSSHPEETRVVVTKGNRLEDFDFESQHKSQIRGNIYLAKVTRVEPSLQAAFVDYGGNRHGFLAFSEIHPDYYQIPHADRLALLEEEAANNAAEFDDEDEAPKKEKSKKRGRRNRRGRSREDRDHQVPDAEPVAMDAILAAYEAAEENDDDDDQKPSKTMAAHADGGDSVSEALDDVFGSGIDSDDDDDDNDDEPDTVEQDDALEESRPRRRVQRKQYKIQEVIKRRQIILVQVVKEERGNKGAALTTYMSLAGRYSVLMPNTARGGGISRKITSIGDRGRLKEIVKELDVPQGMGVILRTAGADRSKADIHRDYDYLMRLWNSVRDVTLKSSAPALVYEEGSLIKRSIRDLYNDEISEIVVAGADAYREAKEFMRMLMPSHAKIVKSWNDQQPIFARSGIEAELDRLINQQVTLKSGGYIIINQTEALVAIDVNSGKSTREMNVEATALATNLEAAEEVARQLRLRDLAGLVVIDFIDMEENRNNRAVEKKFKDCLKADRARIQVGRISHFGLLEMSRQRMRASVLESTMTQCSHCSGTGLVRSVQSVSLHLLRAVEDHLQRNSRNNITVRTDATTAMYVLNQKRQSLAEMEARFGVDIEIAADTIEGTDIYVIDKGEPSTRSVDDLQFEHVSPDSLDDPAQIDADEKAYAAFVENTGTNEASKARTNDNQSDDEADSGRGRKRRRRRGKKSDADNAENNDTDTDNSDQEDASSDDSDDNNADNDGENKRGGRNNKRRSRGRRGGRNRRGRRNTIPAAEPVGPLADMIAEQEAAAKAAAAETEAAKTQDATQEPAAEPTPESKPVEQVSAPVDEAKAEAPEPEAEVAAQPAPEALVDANGEEKKKRVRATESNINLDVKPVVSSTAQTEKPKRGWWRR